jgi:hypothetical protein
VVEEAVRMNSNLLAVVEHPYKRRPLMLDGVPVPRDSGPFLITSTKATMWVERAFGEGFLRLAVREQRRGDLFLDLVTEVAAEGLRRGWGNVYPPTTDGVLEGIKHLHYYDLSDATLLYGSEFDIGVAPDMPRAPADWLPPSWGVLVPDRAYVGTVYLLGDNFLGAVVHNPSRGIVVLRGNEDNDEIPSDLPQV